MFEKPNRQINRVFIHCSASSNVNVNAKEIDRWHKQRGWSGIGYHYFIKTDGTLELGRSLERVPAAQGGNNIGTIAICLNGHLKKDFNEEQFKALKKLCSEIYLAYNGKVTYHGHCEVSSKTCPVFDYKAVLHLNNKGQLGL